MTTLKLLTAFLVLHRGDCFIIKYFDTAMFQNLYLKGKVRILYVDYIYMLLHLFQTLVSAPPTSSNVQTTTASATSASAMGDVIAWMARMKWNVHLRMPMLSLIHI